MLAKMRLIVLLVSLVVGFSGFSGQNNTLTSDELLKLVNQDRQKYHLNGLSLSPVLNLAAFAKASDMIANNYFAHISPRGVKPWYYFKALGYSYTYAGENLGSGFNDASELQSSWMSSPAHRDNILSPDYSDLGVAVVKHGSRILVVEFFGSKNSSLSLRQ